MWSDTSVEAAHASLRITGHYVNLDALKRAIEAAETAAWRSPGEQPAIREGAMEQFVVQYRRPG